MAPLPTSVSEWSSATSRVYFRNFPSSSGAASTCRGEEGERIIAEIVLPNGLAEESGRNAPLVQTFFTNSEKQLLLAWIRMGLVWPNLWSAPEKVIRRTARFSVSRQAGPRRACSW